MGGWVDGWMAAESQLKLAAWCIKRISQAVTQERCHSLLRMIRTHVKFVSSCKQRHSAHGSTAPPHVHIRPSDTFPSHRRRLPAVLINLYNKEQLCTAPSGPFRDANEGACAPAARAQEQGGAGLVEGSRRFGDSTTPPSPAPPRQ